MLQRCICLNKWKTTENGTRNAPARTYIFLQLITSLNRQHELSGFATLISLWRGSRPSLCWERCQIPSAVCHLVMSSILHVSTVKLLTWLGFFQRAFVTTGAPKWLRWFLAIFNFPQTDVLRLQKTIWLDWLQQVRIKPALWLLCLCQTADSWPSPTVTPEVKLHPCSLQSWLAKFCSGGKKKSSRRDPQALPLCALNIQKGSASLTLQAGSNQLM